MRSHISWLFVVVCFLLLSSCNSKVSSADRPTVVATTTILGDIVRNIVADDVNVEVVMGLGVDPHDFAPSSQQAVSIASAELVVANGLGLEAGLTEVLVDALNGGTEMLFVGNHVDPVRLEGNGDGCSTDGAQFENGCDPHFWMDPVRVGRAGVVVADALTDAGLAGPWNERAVEFQRRMLEVDGQISEMFEEIPAGDRQLVTNHNSLGYFARRYGFQLVGVIIPGGSTLGDPSAAELADLIASIEARDVRAIFVDSSDSTALANSLAAESDDPVSVVTLYTGSLGGEGSGAATLPEMLLTNATLIARALK